VNSGGRIRLTRLRGDSEGAVPDRLRCSICGFAGVDRDATPGQALGGDIQIVTRGTRYVWDAPDEPVDTLDKQVEVIPNVRKACPFCTGQLFLDGQRGSAHTVPGR
jgi:hypothetical protein